MLSPKQRLHIVVAGFELQHVVMKNHQGNSGDRAGKQIFEGGLGGAADRNGAAVATHPCKPEDVDFLEGAETHLALAVRGDDVFSQLFHRAAPDIANLIRQAYG